MVFYVHCVLSMYSSRSVLKTVHGPKVNKLNTSKKSTPFCDLSFDWKMEAITNLNLSELKFRL